MVLRSRIVRTSNPATIIKPQERASSATTRPLLKRPSRRLEAPRLSSRNTLPIWLPEARTAGSVPAANAAKIVAAAANPSAPSSSRMKIQ